VWTHPASKQPRRGHEETRCSLHILNQSWLPGGGGESHLYMNNIRAEIKPLKMTAPCGREKERKKEKKQKESSAIQRALIIPWTINPLTAHHSAAFLKKALKENTLSEMNMLSPLIWVWPSGSIRKVLFPGRLRARAELSGLGFTPVPHSQGF